jgi:hypothetical protein
MNQPLNLSASVRQRLKNLAISNKEDFQAILTRFALERFLFRLSQSPYSQQFVLKGALLFSVWSHLPHRATRDLDLLGFGDNSLDYLQLVFQNVCDLDVLPDGLEFHSSSVHCQRIKPDQEYEGVRINILGNLTLSRTRINLQIDIGFGDAISPSPISLQFPTLLDFPPPIVSTYPRETVIAEKFQAMVMLGIANTRMKDFYDIWFLATNFDFQSQLLSSAIKNTFDRRKTPIPISTPLALSAEFTQDQQKLSQWNAFLNKGRLSTQNNQSFTEIVQLIDLFLMPLCLALTKNREFNRYWNSSFSWQQLS